MPLSLDDVRRLAELSRIEVTADEVAAVHEKLDSILELVSELQAVETDGIVPMAHAQDVMLPLRDDRVTETDRHALYQQAAPLTSDGLYLVPKVIE